MKNLASPKVIKEILEESGFKFSKSLGQNFLIDESVLDKMIAGSGIDENTNVIEIGPGFGTLTQRLCMNAKKVVAIEIDSTAVPILEKNLEEFNNLKIINDDVLKCDLEKIIAEEFGGENIKIVANLPYYITTPIIMHILESRVKTDSLCIMIQKEVAQRIAAKPSTKDYGALTVAVNYYSTPRLICNVPPSSFIPMPKVSSSVISLDIRKEPPVTLKNEKGYFKVVKAAFGQRRKTLLNALSNSSAIPLSKDEVLKVLTGCGIDEKRRGETLSLEDFANISNMIFS
ncbi:MAG: 16S rRNA (adenine(1518)-N(6)/adenine(1519)-N(6))-dimethyltransferase RsmA [Clostridia bacterium]|nr:16S rRNA (adenine(1518)-N(6)/adenine(1519)-N(6))-dimethyltransferase RsmA [Clostridia bacterium]MBO7289776.1 16S rRNA (adenine(1518)-N(6)/adenine(1519)-N(6))-dimethyltransferase RsmA [Clostridia bacterium]